MKEKLKFRLFLYIKDRKDKIIKKLEKEQEIEIEFPNNGSLGRQVLKPLDPERLEYAQKENAICKKNNEEILKGRKLTELSSEEYKKLRRLIPLKEPEPITFESADGKKYSILVKISPVRKGLFNYQTNVRGTDIPWELMDAEKYFTLLERAGKQRDPNDKREKIEIEAENIKIMHGPGYREEIRCLNPRNTGYYIIGGAFALIAVVIAAFAVGKKTKKNWAHVSWTHIILGIVIFLVLVSFGLWWWDKKGSKSPPWWGEKNAFTG